MINGNYAISLQTPMGMEKGVITLNESNGILTGTLKALGSNNPIRNGTAKGNKFEFSGTLRKMFARFDYTASGEINGDLLSATADTKYGTFIIKGTRI